MDSRTAPRLQFSAPASAPAAARTVFQLLQRVRHGTLMLHLPDGSVQCFGQQDADSHTSTAMTLKNWNVCAAVLKSGDIGLAESYIAGDWTTPHLVELLQLFIRNRRELEDVVYGSWAGRLLYRVRHLLNRNSRATARKNIHAHYDLGNAFYTLWLDETMNYSSAWFDGQPAQPMVDAQHAKVRRALRMAGVQRGDRVLEIGCGWGALVDMAVNEFGASVTGVTLSTEQLAFAKARMRDTGAAPTMSDLRLQDYRDIKDGPFDAICSIEMVEAGAVPTGPPTSKVCTTCSSPVAAPVSRASSSTTACGTATSARPTSSSSTSFRAAACRAPANSAVPRMPPGWRWWTNVRLAWTMPRPCSAGGRASWRSGPRC